MRTLGSTRLPRGLLLGSIVLSAGCVSVNMPGKSFEGALAPLGGHEIEVRSRLARHVGQLAGNIGARNVRHPEQLRAAAEYIQSSLEQVGYRVDQQSYEVDGQPVSNLETEIPGSTEPGEIVILGAHYDSVGDCPGANDNASGVAAVLELARLLRASRLDRTVRFVLFVNEEPPYFGTPDRGSLRYANRSRGRGEKIVAMLSLETIGYYSDAEGSQRWPFPFNLVYPSTGDFLGFITRYQSRRLLRETVRSFRRHARFPSRGGAGPESVDGVGWSDHASFWQAGYPAVMVTDTAPFRYPHYHRRSDTPDKLDYDRAARVVVGLAGVARDLARSGGS